MRLQRTGFTPILITLSSTLALVAGFSASHPPHHSVATHHSAAHGSLVANRSVGWTGASRSAISYADHVDNLERWSHFPITVGFRHDANYSPQRQAAILAGFRQWVGATRGVVAFSVVNDPRSADVTVSCDPSRVISQTDTEYDPDTHILTHAAVTMGLQSPDSSSARVNAAELQGLAAHEFGHTLGINGHSDSPRDLMYPTLGDYNRAITLRDLNTLRIAYLPGASTRTVSQ